MYKLRWYQQDAVYSAAEFLSSKSKKKPIIIAPTGSGKSLVIANIITSCETKTIVLQPNKELLEQNYEKYTSYGYEASIYSASLRSKELSDVTFATIGSIAKEADKIAEMGYELLLVDESHFSTKKESKLYNFIQETDIKKIIGLTATPIELRSYFGEAYLAMINRSQKNIFNDILHVTQIKNMVEENFWTKLKYDIKKVPTKSLVLNSSGTEFTDKSLNIYYETANLKDKIDICLHQNQDRKSALIFVPGISNAKRLEKELEGVRAVYSGMKSKERRQVISDFKSGKLRAVANCNILSMGFDFPALDHIIMARPTNSFAVYYQQIGRVVRPHSSKQDGLITDYAGNVKRFGELDDIAFLQDEKGRWGMYNGGKLTTICSAKNSIFSQRYS